MRHPLIAGNWKMHKGPSEAKVFALELAQQLRDVEAVEVVLAPPFVSLLAVRQSIAGTPLRLAAQNVFWEREGAFTGEISPPMLKDAGCSYAIVGHSERRNHFGETDEDVNRKVKALLAEGLGAIVCVGESLEEREKGETFDVVRKQVEGALKGLTDEDLKGVVIAYEPVWAIGTGRTATPKQAQEVHSFIRKMIEGAFGKEVAQTLRILYGGSVKPDNIDDLMGAPDIDGALVGGASLKVDSFVKIVNFGRQKR